MRSVGNVHAYLLYPLILVIDISTVVLSNIAHLFHPLVYKPSIHDPLDELLRSQRGGIAIVAESAKTLNRCFQVHSRV